MSVQYNLIQRIVNGENYIRKKLYEKCHRNFKVQVIGFSVLLKPNLCAIHAVWSWDTGST